jgi:hypothetical protein
MTNRSFFRLPLLSTAALVTALALALLAARSYAVETAASAGPKLHYYRAENVAKSFAEGAVLFAEPGINYMIHTSRRTAPGMAEVHTQDTDLIHVLEGS